MVATRSHWEDVYGTKHETAVSWYQPHSMRSLELIDETSPNGKASVIDVGGGAATLVDDLLVRGFVDLTVLDIAETALDRSKARLGRYATKIGWIVADVTRWTPTRTWDIWHDRAVFHFLTERSQQEAHVAALTTATRPGATVIVSPKNAADWPSNDTVLKPLAVVWGPVLDRLKSVSESMPNVKFEACGNTREAMAKAEGKKTEEIPIFTDAVVVKAGVVSLIELNEKGWTIIRP